MKIIHYLHLKYIFIKCTFFSYLFLTFILIFSINTLCLAEVYKYKDERGNWQYSDKPPPSGQSTETIEGIKENKPASSNLKNELFDEFQSETPIEKATLAVVTIETPLGIGSGFFISGDGHILTNRHIVRPSDSTGVQEIQNTINELEEIYREGEKEIKRRKAELRNMKNTLDRYKIAISNAKNNSERELMQREYDIMADKHRTYVNEYNEVKRAFNSDKNEYEKAKREFNIKKYSSIIKTSFDIVTKGNKHLSARLVKVSEKNDLALLKVDGYETPSIEFAEVQSISQGSTVYAIGSPLGIKDVVTSGVIMKIEDDYIMTDTQILPGNSGGPLINEEGLVIGINTLQIIEQVTRASESFGIAIQINVANDEFKNVLSN